VKIRRYYGHDCDSVSGFNDGYYLDDEFVEVKNHAEAERLCKEALAERWACKDKDLEDIDGTCFQLTTGYYDNDGNDLTRDAWIEANEDKETGCYRYVYVSYEVIGDEEDAE
jgi:hypothetical protein